MYTKYSVYPNQHSMNGGKWRTDHPGRRTKNIDRDKKLVRGASRWGNGKRACVSEEGSAL